jgi:hypothetical protein
VKVPEKLVAQFHAFIEPYCRVNLGIRLPEILDGVEFEALQENCIGEWSENDIF